MHTVIETNDDLFQQHWDTLLSNDPVQHPLYESYSQKNEQQTESVKDLSRNYRDCSFLVVSEDQPIFGCSVTLHVDQRGRKRLGYFGLDAYTHVNRASLNKPSNNFSPEAIRLLQQHIDHLLEQERPEAIDYFDPVSCGIMSPVTQVLLQKGALPTVHQVQLINLQHSRSELFAQLSEECQQNILQAEAADVSVETSVVASDDAVIDVVLPLESELESQEQSIQAQRLHNYLQILNRGQGFLVQATIDKALAASALFVHSNRTCQYVYADLLQDGNSSSFPERQLLQQVVWRGMLEGRARGCELFDFGYQQANAATVNRPVLAPEDFGGVSHTRLKVSLSAGSSIPAH